MSENKLAIVDRQQVALDPRRLALSVDPFEPQTMPELYKFAEAVALTEFAPPNFKGKVNDCFIAMIYGRGLGLGALQALQGVCVINGKPSVYGDTFWAVIISHPDFVDCVEDVTDERAQCIITRRGQQPHTATFTMTEAAVAKLTAKDGPWKTYPKGQLLWRARHRAAVAKFADALKGILPREIADDYVTIEAVASTPTEARSDPAPMAVAVKGEQSKAAAKADEDPLVTPAQVDEWNDARKKAGIHKADAAREFIKSLGLQRSGEMRVSHLARAMAWATTAPEPVAATEPEPNDSVEDGGDENMPERQCREWMTALGMGMFDQDILIKRRTREGVIEWGMIATDLLPDLKTRGLIES